MEDSSSVRQNLDDSQRQDYLEVILLLLSRLFLLLLAPPERKRAKNAYLADLSGCGLIGTIHTFEVFYGPEILRIRRIAFVDVRLRSITGASMPKP